MDDFEHLQVLLKLTEDVQFTCRAIDTAVELNEGDTIEIPVRMFKMLGETLSTLATALTSQVELTSTIMDAVERMERR
jgi:hypothetical protein